MLKTGLILNTCHGAIEVTKENLVTNISIILGRIVMKTADRAEVNHYMLPKDRTTGEAILVSANLSILETVI